MPRQSTRPTYLAHKLVGGRPATSTGTIVQTIQRLNAFHTAPTLQQIAEESGIRKDTVSRVLRDLQERAYLRRLPLPGAPRIGMYVLGSYAHVFGIELTVEQQACAAEEEVFLIQIAAEGKEGREARKHRRHMQAEWYRQQERQQLRESIGHKA